MSGRYKRYPKYKDSGVEWLGKIPEHWSAKRLKFGVKLNPTASELVDVPVAADVSFVPMEAVGEYGGIDLATTKPFANVTSGYTYFRDGDTVVAKITPCFENGKGAHAAGLTNGIAFGTTELHVLRARPEIDPRFLFYVSLSDAFRKLGEAEMYGAGGQKRVPESFIADLRHPVPPRPEQREIVAFLDRETGRIDALVAKKERLIELLQENRSALIAKAVTKGLDATVPMRDSCVEWLGEIPGHWHVRKLKHVCSRVFVGIAEAATFAYTDEGVPMLRSTDVRANRIRTDDIRRIDRGFAAGMPSKQLKADDIVTVRTGNAGVSALVPPEYDGGQCFTLVVSRLAADHVPRYFCHLLNAFPGQQQFAIEGMGTAQVNISVPIVRNVVVSVPPTEEQERIADWIDQELEAWDAFVEAARNAIETLNELRVALVSAAVTGKIDVRGQVAVQVD